MKQTNKKPLTKAHPEDGRRTGRGCLAGDREASRDGLELTTSKIGPWLVQLSLRQNRLHELLHHLTGNAVWMLVQGRLRPHQIKRNQLAMALSKASSSLSQPRR